METTIETIFISLNEEYGIESKVTVNNFWNNVRWVDSFHVSLRDVDANQIIDSIRIFKDETKAIEYAKTLVA